MYTNNCRVTWIGRSRRERARLSTVACCSGNASFWRPGWASSGRLETTTFYSSNSWRFCRDLRVARKLPSRCSITNLTLIILYINFQWIISHIIFTWAGVNWRQEGGRRTTVWLVRWDETVGASSTQRRHETEGVKGRCRRLSGCNVWMVRMVMVEEWRRPSSRKESRQFFFLNFNVLDGSPVVGRGAGSGNCCGCRRWRVRHANSASAGPLTQSRTQSAGAMFQHVRLQFLHFGKGLVADDAVVMFPPLQFAERPSARLFRSVGDGRRWRRRERCGGCGRRRRWGRR